ncbi:hypothetical protein C8Q80DRAFT_480257 [Daedaleopsis nitida]|nr:hypothetical protein C8Q80DRAFT_480257 [Daedaleopsis nitida]
MRRCVELSRLPKRRGGLTSVKFKRTTPGTIGFISRANKPPSIHRVLDPKHPALRYTPAQFAKAFPWRTYPGFAFRAVPKGLLEKPANLFPNPPFAFAPLRTAEGQQNDGECDWVSMSLMDVGGKIEGRRVVQVKVLNKLKNAISLVATRGADVEEGEGRAQRMVFRPERLGADWVMSDWTYICRIDPEVYTMPYTNLIPTLRRALDDVVVHAKQLEAQWAAERTQQVAAAQLPVPAQTVTVQKKLVDESQRPSALPIPPFPKVLSSPASLAAPTSLVDIPPSPRPGMSPLLPPLSSTPSEVSPALHAMMKRFREDRLSVTSQSHVPNTRSAPRKARPLRAKA